MPKFSCINIIKSKAKKLVQTQNIKHSEALELLAKGASFSNYHELLAVAQSTPMDARLVLAAFGEKDLNDAIFSDQPYVSFLTAVDEAFESEIASTNACDFTVENLCVDETETKYDEEKGILTLNVSFEYQGDQLPEKVYSGSGFYVDAIVRLIRRENEWQLEEEGLDIIDIESDTDRDYYDEVEDM